MKQRRKFEAVVCFAFLCHFVFLSEGFCNFEKSSDFESPEILSECNITISNATFSFRNLSRVSVNNNNVENVTSNMIRIVKSVKDLSPFDFLFIADTIDKISTLTNVSDKVIQNLVELINLLLEINYKIWAQSQEIFQASNRIAHSFKETIFNRKETTPFQLATPNVRLTILKSNGQLPVGIAFSKKCETSSCDLVIHSDELMKSPEFEVAVLLTDFGDQFGNDSSITISFILYNKRNIFLSSNEIDLWKERKKDLLSDYAISIEAKNEQSQWLHGKTSIIYTEIEDIDDELLNQSACANWEHSRDGNNFGNWSVKKGCELVESKKNKITCLCDTFGEFTVYHPDILERKIYPTAFDDLGLDIIHWIFCPLSLFGLIIIVITYIRFKPWKKSQHKKMLVCFSLSLIGYMSTMLIADYVPMMKPGCITLRAFEHLFFLATCAWMLAIGFSLYLRFVILLGNNVYFHLFFSCASAFCWGVPIVTVLMNVSIHYNFYYLYPGHFCYMSGQNIFYAFGIPSATVALMNIIFFILIAKTILPRQRVNSDKAKHEIAMRKFRATVLLMTILGITWILYFGALYVDSIVLWYLDAIFFSLQGFFIFLLQIVFEPNARDFWCRRQTTV